MKGKLRSLGRQKGSASLGRVYRLVPSKRFGGWRSASADGPGPGARSVIRGRAAGGGGSTAEPLPRRWTSRSCPVGPGALACEVCDPCHLATASKVSSYGRFIMTLHFFCRSNYVLWVESNLGAVRLFLLSRQLLGWRLPLPALPVPREQQSGLAGASGSGCARLRQDRPETLPAGR